MGGWVPVSPWKIIDSSGQTVSLTTSTAASFTNKVGTTTHAIAVRFTPAATAFVGFVRISATGAAAAAETDYPLASSDGVTVIGCNPGDKVSMFQASGSTQSAYMCELSH